MEWKKNADILIFSATISMVAVGGLALNAYTDTKRPVPSAKCTGLKVNVLDDKKQIIMATASHEMSGGAAYESTTYLFDPDVLPVTVPAAHSLKGEVTHDYPNDPNDQTHDIVAIIDYSSFAKPGVFGSVAMCDTQVTFNL